MQELLGLLRELLRPGPRRTVIFIDTDGLSQRTHSVQYGTVRKALLGGSCFLVCATVLIMAYTPVRTLIPGYTTKQLRQDALLATLRLEAIEDSLTQHLEHLTYLRQIMTGQVDTAATVVLFNDPLGLPTDPDLELTMEHPSDNREDHTQLAVTLRTLIGDRFPAGPGLASLRPEYELPSMLLPAVAPVRGYVTRPFEARTRHLGIDIAIEEGSIVHSIGDGHVIFADWSYGGGHTLIVQHADGYVTVFKHNQHLLKGVADRVERSEAVAISGNTGQHTTGPHLHFELWNNGLAQNPRNYLVGL